MGNAVTSTYAVARTYTVASSYTVASIYTLLTSGPAGPTDKGYCPPSSNVGQSDSVLTQLQERTLLHVLTPLQVYTPLQVHTLLQVLTPLQVLGKPLLNSCHLYCGIAQIGFDPPPRTHLGTPA